MSLLNTIFNGQNRKVKAYEPIVARTNELEADVLSLSDMQLKAKTANFKERIKEKVASDKPALGQRHFDVQIMGGAVLHNGNIAEMRTGEGKTLVATLPVYLNALTGRGVHVVTVNDYLSR